MPQSVSVGYQTEIARDRISLLACYGGGTAVAGVPCLPALLETEGTGRCWDSHAGLAGALGSSRSC